MNQNLQKITSDTNECTAARFFDGKSRVSVPLFQRGYAWERKHFDRFREDIERARELDDRAQFLGAIVAVRRTAGINDPTEFEVVDGQQRMITIYLTVLAGVSVLAASGTEKVKAAANIARDYLYLPTISGPNTKLFPSRLDTSEFAEVWEKVLENPLLKSELGPNLPTPPPSSGAVNDKPKLTAQYLRIRKWLERAESDASDSTEPSQGGKDAVMEIIEAALSRMSMVYLELQDPASAPQVFEGLNNGGLKVSVGDLVRNEVFSRLRSDPQKAKALFDGPWKAFEGELGQAYQEFFFPYGLILDAQTKKGDLFSALRARWKATGDVSAIIDEMREYVPAFRAVELGEPPSGSSSALARVIRRYRIKGWAPGSVRPFVMRVVHALGKGDLAVDDAVGMLEGVEAFLVRRAICGIEPTGLHAVFKGLWDGMGPSKKRSAMIARINSHSTVQQPSDSAVRQAIAERQLYGAKVTPFLVLQFDLSLGGDTPDAPSELEHVLPQKAGQGWEHFTEADKKRILHTWPNLVVCSKPMNKDISNGAYSEKRSVYIEDAMYKSTRELGKKYAIWDVASVEARATELADFALARWPAF